MRFDVALKNLKEDVHGSYGEFPLTGLLALLEHPAVNDVLVAAEEGWGHSEGSVDDADKVSRAAAFHPEEDCDEDGDSCIPEQTANAFQPSLVDVGSGAGRLLLAASTMRPWRSVVGIEASKPLAGLGAAAIAKLEDARVLPRGAVRSIHADAYLGEVPWSASSTPVARRIPRGRATAATSPPRRPRSRARTSSSRTPPLSRPRTVFVCRS